MSRGATSVSPFAGRWRGLTVALLSVLLVEVAGAATTSIAVSPEIEKVDLADATYMLEDPSHQLDLDAVRSPVHAAQVGGPQGIPLGVDEGATGANA